MAAHTWRMSSAGAFLLLAAGLASAQPTITVIPRIPSTTEMGVSGLSSDGSTVIGYGFFGFTGVYQYFRWTVAGGYDNLSIRTNGVNADGSVVVGSRRVSGSVRPYIWSASGDYEQLPRLPYNQNFPDAEALGVSGDGSVVVGYSPSFSTTQIATRWTRATGTQPIDSGDPFTAFLQATAVSADGQVVIGTSRVQGFVPSIFRSTGPNPEQNQRLGYLDALEGGGESWPSGVNADGRVVIGYSLDSNRIYRAIRWTPETGMVNIDNFPGSTRSFATGVNADGSAVVGYVSLGPTQTRGVLWTPTAGMVDLNDYLSGAGVNLTGWTITFAYGISGDGTVMTGFGLLNGTGQFWIATGLPPIPGTSCAADFNHDGHVDPDDLSDYIACFFAAPPCPQADFNADTHVDPDDLSDFIATFFGAC